LFPHFSGSIYHDLNALGENLRLQIYFDCEVSLLFCFLAVSTSEQLLLDIEAVSVQKQALTKKLTRSMLENRQELIN
jgi:hypothetical protein